MVKLINCLFIVWFLINFFHCYNNLLTSQLSCNNSIYGPQEPGNY